MTSRNASDIAARTISDRLGLEAEAVCRHYLSSGRKAGRYWQVGDIHNSPGRSLFLRIKPTAKGPAGKWVDAATGEHGDLLDVIRATCRLTTFADVLAEARRFLGLPDCQRKAHQPAGKSMSIDTVASARRLIALTKPIGVTLAETWLRHRGITRLNDLTALRYHPRCYHRAGDEGPRSAWPAMIGTVTDQSGTITGVHRTWLAQDGLAKAPVDPQRKALGDLYGNAIRFGMPMDGTLPAIMAAGEGIETVLSVREALPFMPMLAALSANHLSALAMPASLSRLYIIRDNDASGRRAARTLSERAAAAGIETIVLKSRLGDFNDDLRVFGPEALKALLRVQIVPEDVERFMILA